MSPTGKEDASKVLIVVPPDAPPERLDRFLAEHKDAKLTRNRIQKLIADSRVLVNKKLVSKRLTVRPGDRIELSIPPLEPSELVPEDIPLEVVFEDDHLAVINKPAGLVTHPGAGNFTGTLANALAHHFQQLPDSGGSERPGLIHRLDKDTSGLLLIAKSESVYQSLQQAMQKREIKRTYMALVCGHLKEEQGIINLPVGRSHGDRKKMAVMKKTGREAITHYRLTNRYRSYDLLEVVLETGRTHQIRVHFAHLGHPVFGDPQYGGRDKWHRGIFAPERLLAKKLLEIMPRQALHAYRLAFKHPVTAKKISLETALPPDFAGLIAVLDREGV